MQPDILLLDCSVLLSLEMSLQKIPNIQLGSVAEGMVAALGGGSSCHSFVVGGAGPRSPEIAAEKWVFEKCLWLADLFRGLFMSF